MILIIRPKKESFLLKRKIDQLGLESCVDSISSFKGIKKNDLSVSKKTIVLISSPRAANTILNSNIISTKTPLLIIGRSSFKKLKQNGFEKIIYTSQDSKNMYRYIKKHLKNILNTYPNYKITYLSGSVSNLYFVKKLNALGIKRKIIYKTVFKNSLDTNTINLIRKKKIKVCLLYSQANAKHLVKLLNNQQLKTIAKDILFVSLSANISKLMIDFGFQNLISVKKPNQKNMLAVLSKIYML